MNADDIIERIKEEEMMCEYCEYNNKYAAHMVWHVMEVNRLNPHVRVWIVKTL